MPDPYGGPKPFEEETVMADLDRMISRILASPTAKGVAGGLLASALTSKSGRKLGKRALKVGGIAAIAGLAYTAFERHRRGQGAEPLPAPGPAFLPPVADAAPRTALGLSLVRTMIAAARADGKLDGSETAAVLAEIGRLDLAPEEKALLLDELARPVGIEEIAASAENPEHAAELYTAALLAIEVDTPAERAWLAALAARLGLASGLAAEIEARVVSAGAAPGDAVAASAPGRRSGNASGERVA
jgi:uncharacterized membrane protein YebE (DUF533 family)